MQDGTIEYYMADRRLRWIASSRGYQLEEIDVLDMLDLLLQRPGWQDEYGCATDEGLNSLLDEYGYDPLPKVCN